MVILMNCCWLSTTNMREKPPKAAVLVGPPLSQAFPVRNPTRLSWWGYKKDLLWVLRAEDSRHYEMLSIAFSAAKAYSPGKRIVPGQIPDSSWSKKTPLCSSPIQPSCLLETKQKHKSKESGFKEIDEEHCSQGRGTG